MQIFLHFSKRRTRRPSRGRWPHRHGRPGRRPAGRLLLVVLGRATAGPGRRRVAGVSLCPADEEGRRSCCVKCSNLAVGDFLDP